MKFLRNLITCYFPKYISWINLSLLWLVFNLFWNFYTFYNSDKYHHSIAKETKTFKQRIYHCTRVVIDYIIFFFSLSLVRRKHVEHGPQITRTLLKKTLWPLFMNGVQLPQGHSHFEEAVYFIPLIPKNSCYSFYQPPRDERLSRPYTVLGTRLMQKLFAWSDFCFALICHVLHLELELFI